MITVIFIYDNNCIVKTPILPIPSINTVLVSKRMARYKGYFCCNMAMSSLPEVYSQSLA